ncbi:unnamed protein product [Macrosiphum euphorbiae]|uniref:Uncharacterized protein n=1 Tax=Macrosiphum euphorbiae TaxID=13131 RepID=A0AAV0Y0Z6_9HEMI|nr:unnamed protein product [Macrosiphum euphorbiae]
MVTGVFLDPRYQCLLDESTKHQAKSHLIDVFNLMNALSSEISDKIKTFISQDEEPKTHVTHVNDTDDSLEENIRNKTNVALENNLDIENLDSLMPVPIRLLLESFDGTSRLHNSVDVRIYWEKEKKLKTRTI